MLEAIAILGPVTILAALFLLLFGPHFFTSGKRIAAEDVTFWNRINAEYSEADCGCVYKDKNWTSYEPHTELVTGDLAESRKYWKEVEKGAKKQYKLYEEKLYRCTNCGNFVFEEEKIKNTGLQWPEEPMPDSVAESNHEIRET